MSWIDYKKAKANAPQLAGYAVAIPMAGVIAWYTGRFPAFLIGTGVVVVLVAISVINYWIRKRKVSD